MADPEDRVRRLEAALASKAREVEALRAEIDRVSAQLAAVLGSSSWRLSWPLRAALTRSPAARKALRRAAKLTWWTVTLQVHRRLAARLADPAAALPQPSPAPLLPAAADGATPSLPAPAVAAAEKERFTRAARAELLDFLRSGARLAFPAGGSAAPGTAPDISVVVVLWNQAHLTLRCLRALHAQAGASFEIILVDNASSDETGALLARVDGVRVLSSATNEGFVLGCNRGAAAARGRTVLLLNSDAFVRPGTLAAALATLDSAPDVGAVGARLILPTGRLQEAGSIVWADGSTLGYGRDLAEDAGEAMFRREVDYCSGAFLLTRRDLWERLGGLDAGYAPAYYEETDYCMRLRETGARVMHEPAAAVDHFEFGSEAKRGDAVATLLRNRKRFRARHATALRQRHLPPNEANLPAARERLRPEQRRLLAIDNETPLGALGSGYPRARAMLQDAVALGWAVTFFPLHRPAVDWDQVRREIPWEVEIATGWAAPRLAEFLEQRRGLFDAVLVSRPDNMGLVRAALRGREHLLHGVRLIYDAEALFSLRDITRAEAAGAPLPDADREAAIAAEVALAEDADAVVCVNEIEAAVFRERHLAPVTVLSHPTEPRAGTPGFAARAGFLFVGRLLERSAPNWDGLAWFVRECWPLIRAALPDADLAVAGHTHADDAELRAPGVRLLGPVDDLGPLYDAARVFVAPVRFAAGIPIKILEAAAAGLPSAGTTLMARQLGWTPGVEMVAADDAAALASGAVALHLTPAPWDAMRRAATERLRAEHGAAAFRERLRALLDADRDALAPAAEAGPDPAGAQAGLTPAAAPEGPLSVLAAAPA